MHLKKVEMKQLQPFKGASLNRLVWSHLNTLVHRDIQVFDLHLTQFQISRDSEVQGSPL